MTRLTALLAILFISSDVTVLAYELKRLFVNIPGDSVAIVNAMDIDDSGNIVGFFYQSGGHGFLYDGETTTILDVPGGTETNAFGNNDIGDIVGNYLLDGVSHGFFYNGTTYTTLIAKQVDEEISPTSANDINDSGVIVGSAESAFDGTNGFTYKDGIYTPLYGPAGGPATPWGINDSGVIVGISGSVGFIKDGDDYTTLDFPGADYATHALSVNNAGVVVGVYYKTSGGDENGFIWEEGTGFSPLDFEGASKTKVTGINNSNDVVGTRNTVFSFYGLGEPSPTDVFLWTGEALDNDWHKALNWDDEETGEDAEEPPGDPSGDGPAHTVHINGENVSIMNGARSVRSLDATGSLSINQSLTLGYFSSVENLTLQADLNVQSGLSLQGESAFNQGTITGPGAVVLGTDATAQWPTVENGGQAEQQFSVEFGVQGLLFMDAGVSVDIFDGGTLSIYADGTFGGVNGKLTNSSSSADPAVINKGTILILGLADEDRFTIEAPMLNEGGTIDVVSGGMTLKNATEFEGGTITVRSRSRLVLETPEGVSASAVTASLTASGDGTIEFSGNGIIIEEGHTASFNMSLALGGMEINDYAIVYGKGTLHNAGRMVFNKGEIASKIVNDGTFVVSGEAPDPPAIRDTQLINNSTLLQQQEFIVDVESDSDPRQGIINNGTYEIGSAAILLGLNGTFENPAIFSNGPEGNLKKTGANPAIFDGIILENKGRVSVTGGTLHLFNSIWLDNPGIGGNTNIEIAAGAGLYLENNTEQYDILSLDQSHDFFNRTEIQGGGTLTIDGLLFLDPSAGSAELAIVNNASRLILRPREIYGEADTISAIENLGGSIRIENPDGLTSDLKMNRVDLINRDESSIIHEDGVTLVLEDGARLVNEGEYRFKSGSSAIERGVLTNERKVVRNTGDMIFESGEAHVIEPVFEFVTAQSRGRVNVINETSVSIERPDYLIFDAKSLLIGNWLIGPGSEIDLRGPLGNEINLIGADVSIRLEGSHDGLVADARINNLPNVTGDFTNAGELTLAGSTFRTTGDFNNTGNLFLNPGVLIAEGANGFFNQGDLGGTGAINGKVVNGGEFVPGLSPGSITINGDYTQTETGSLQIELGGLDPSFDYDQLLVNGMAAFESGATINITLIDPNPDDAVDEIFVPLTGDVFTFLVADEITLPAGTTLADYISFANLPTGVELEFQLNEVNGMTEVALVADSTLTPPVGPRITIHPKVTTSTAGDIATFSVTADGATDLAYQWRLNGVDLPDAITSTYTLPSVQALHAGDYSVVVTGEGISVTSKTATLDVAAPAPNDARLLNLSTRAVSLTGSNVLIPGFVIAGPGSKSLLIRAVGATLRADPFNIATALEDPQMTLKRWTGSAFEDVDTNDDWQTNSNADEITQAIIDLGAFALTDSRDAALLADLPAGLYTVVAGGVDDLTGVAIVELYDGDGDSSTTVLTNISNRGFVGTGASIMIPGVTVSAEGPKTFLVRAVGPALGQAPFNLTGVLEDPKMTIFAGQEPILSNDNWGDSPNAAYTAFIAAQLGAFALPEGSKDAAFVVTLPPGSYTIQAVGVDGATGTAIVEVYVVE